MSLFSYVDITTGFLYFNLDAEFTPEERAYIASNAELWDLDHASHIPFLRACATRALSGKYRHKYLHEWCHMLQFVWFPYLYLHTWKELTIVRWLRMSLAKAQSDIPIGKISLEADFAELIQETAMVHPLQRTAGRIVVGDRVPDLKSPSPYDLTIIDLLEDFASMFEYKCGIQGDGNGDAYATWLSDPANKAYSNVFWLLGDLWDVDFAYRLLPAVVQISFHTDWVFNAFVSLLSWLLASGPACKDLSTEQLHGLLEGQMYRWGSGQSDGSKAGFARQGLNRLKRALSRSGAEAPRAGRFGLLVRDVSEFDTSPYTSAAFPRTFHLRDASTGTVVGTTEAPTGPTLLTPQFMRTFITKTQRHPLFSYAKKYTELCQRDNVLKTALFHPHQAEIFGLLQREFAPVVQVIHLEAPTLKGRDTLIQLAAGFVEETSPAIPEGAPDRSSRNHLTDIMKRKDTAWSLATDINGTLPHQCHHTVCPYHPTDLCRRWSAIPRLYWRCAFPNWFCRVYEMKIDPNAMSLRPQGEGVGMNTRSLHIEGDPQIVEDFRKFIFDQSPELARAIRPLNDISPGFAREPVMIALVVALGGPVIVKELCSLAKRYLDRLDEGDRQKHEERVLRIMLEERGGQKVAVSLTDLERMANDPAQIWKP